MKKRKSSPVFPEDLVTKFRLDPEGMEGLVNQVNNGQHPELVRPDLIRVIRRAAALELEPALIDPNKHRLKSALNQVRLGKVAVLQHYLDLLNSSDESVVGSVELPENGDEILLPGQAKVFIGALQTKHIPLARRILMEAPSRERDTFPVRISDGSPSVLFDFIGSLQIPCVVAVGDDKEGAGIAAIHSSFQFPSIGNVSMAVGRGFDSLGLREALLEWIVKLAPAHYRTLEAEVCDDQLSTIFAFRQAEFDETKLPGRVSDGFGGFVSRIKFSLEVRPNEDYLSAAD